MPLAPQQIRKLKSRLNQRHVRTREVEGRTIAYLEGWHVIAEANRIFGFDGWDRELVDSSCVYTRQQGERFNAAYVARIRIKVRAGEHWVTREGSGAGESSASTPGQAHELALKAAETDATKRAFMTFGNPFGLSLYGPAKEEPARQGAAEDTKPNGATPAPGTYNGRVPSPRAPVAPDHESGEGANKSDCAGLTLHQALHSGNASEEVEAPGEAVPEISRTEPGPAANNTAAQGRTRFVPTHCPDTQATSGEHRGVEAAAASIELAEPDTPSRHRPNPPAAACPRGAVEDRQVGAGARRADPHPRSGAPEVRRQLSPASSAAATGHRRTILRFAQPKAMGRKVSDEYTVPLCSLHHRLLHQTGNEIAWWEYQKIDPLAVAAELWRQSRAGGKCGVPALDVADKRRELASRSTGGRVPP